MALLPKIELGYSLLEEYVQYFCENSEMALKDSVLWIIH